MNFSLSLNKAELDLLIKFLVVRKRSLLPLIEYVALKDKYLPFLWGFASKTVRIPSKRELAKVSLYSKVYNFLRENNFSDSAMSRAQVRFKIRPARVRAIRVLGDRAILSFNARLSDYIKSKESLFSKVSL